MGKKYAIVGMSAPVAIAAAEGDSPETPKSFTATFYTGGPLNIAGWDLPVVVDLSGLKAGNVLVANLDHDSTKRVGNFEAINDGKSLVAVGKATAATAARDEVVKSAQAGYQWQASLEVNPTRVETLAKGKTVTVNGQEITGPAYITRAGVLKGFGFVSHGADDNTTATIAASAATKKETEMDPKLKQWIEAMGFDPEQLDETQLAGLKANFEGRQDKKSTQVAAGFDAIKAERERQEQIMAYALDKCEQQPLNTDAIKQIAEQAIDEKWPVDKLRLEILEAMTPESRPPIFRRRDEIAVSAKLIEAALCAEHGYSKLEKDYDEKTLQMARDKYGDGIGLRQLYRICAKANGYTGDDDSVTMDMHRYACRLVPGNGRQQHAANSTISLPGILSNIANKFLADGWEAGDMTWREVSAQRTVRDFKANTTYKLSGSFKYEKVGNGGELKHGTVSEDTYTNQAETYGKMFGVSRTDIINDDLGAFTSILREMSFGAIDSFNEVFWTEFLADQSTFFAAGNNNTSSGVWSSAALATLTAAELVFMNQTQPNGRPLGMMPDRILVPPGAKRYALNALSSTQIVGTTGPTPAANSFAGEYKVLSTPYIANSAFTGYSTVKWYMICNPARLAMIEACFLNGKQTPTVEQGEASFSTLGVQMRGYHDFGCNKQEYRAVVQGSGA